MIINYVPGEECRIALLEDGKLEEYYAERANQASHVGNIYRAKVASVESSIQAAFVDIGLAQKAFLHVSDLHPRFFPGNGKNTTEPVGQKTPHRERPPMQDCLKRGQEILVQVLKEGLGTKGPTVTSYLSIPGRYLVMMPGMEGTGVSRKVEDFDERRDIKSTLEKVELPGDFGFILRTAGIDKTKTELKRDLGYLQRLWKKIEGRKKKGKAPQEVYVEANLLVRTIRDVLTPDIEQIIVDHPAALKRIEEFLRIAAPRSHKGRLLYYNKPMPIFHAFGIEEQIRSMSSRQVPLRTGGYLVIDQTEAMVAIDVNSGRMRSTDDAESTAYKVNQEAVDEVSRQLRLRDLGGLVVIDLIDMRSPNHRRQVENRMRDNLKRDRAKAELLRISRFGLLEMTRQRMRPSHASAENVECGTCRGRGKVQVPEATAAEAMRDLAQIAHAGSAARVEMVVSDAVAGTLLSRFRSTLTRIESESGRKIDVRVSKSIPADRVDFYAYDENNADLDIEKILSKLHKAAGRLEPSALVPYEELDPEMLRAAEAAAGLEPEDEFEDLGEFIEEEDEESAETADESATETEETSSRRRRGRRGRGREGQKSDVDTQPAKPQAESESAKADGSRSDSDDEGEDSARSRRRRRGRRGRGRSKEEAGDAKAAAAAEPGDSTEQSSQSAAAEVEAADGAALKKKRRRRGSRGGKGRKRETQTAEATTETSGEPTAAESTAKPAEKPVAVEASAESTSEGEGERKRGRRRRRGRRGKGGGENGVAAQGEAPATPQEKPVQVESKGAGSESGDASKVVVDSKTPRRLYKTRRRLRPDELTSITARDE